MNAGILPIAILFFALGLGLSFSPLRAALVAVAAMVVAAVALSYAPLPRAWLEAVFVGLWVSVIGSICLAYVPRRVPQSLAIAAGLNGGVWAGSLAGLATMRPGMVMVMPLVLSLFLGRAVVALRQPIAVKVVGSWVIAVATLAIFVSLTPTPGYQQDHMQ
ncbi:MAG: hypothetical protein ABIO85_06185 [Sphingomicrobium sp.]